MKREDVEKYIGELVTLNGLGDLGIDYDLLHIFIITNDGVRHDI